MLNPAQLAKFGMNLAASNQDSNTLSEKWEALAVLPLNDPAAPNDYLLLVGNDNDFRAPVVYHNGQPVGTNEIYADNMLLAFRIGADAIAPSVQCPPEAAVPAGPNCSVPNVTDLVSVSDNSAAPVTLTQDPPAGSPVGLGVVTVYVVATDAAGNTNACAFALTVTNPPPTLTGPASLTVSASATCDALVPDLTVATNVVASDNCGESVALAQTPSAGTVAPLGTNLITLVATDASGNTTTKSVRLIVVDRTAPTVECPPDVTVPADLNCQGMIPDLLANLVATDACSSPVTLSQSPTNGTLVGLGTHPVLIVARDAAGNVARCTNLVTVADLTPPQLVCPASAVVEFVEAAGAPAQYPLPTAPDNCSTSLVVCAPASGSLFPIGSTPVVCTAADAQGNTASCTFTVTVLGAYSVKERVRDDLVALKLSVTNRHTAQKLGIAIQYLNRSLRASLWEDETHLVPCRGSRVFEDERRCVQTLLELTKCTCQRDDDDDDDDDDDGDDDDDRYWGKWHRCPPTGVDRAYLLGLIDRIVDCDDLLAEVAVAEAEEDCPQALRVAMAKKALAKGDRLAAAGQYPAAIDAYLKAWRLATASHR
jgi:hypothetical protein